MQTQTVEKKPSPRRRLLNRGNLRDVVVILAAASALAFPLAENVAVIIVGFTVLALGCALHVLVKGVLIRNTVLCREGIYSIVRNPYYLSNFIIDFSFCLLSGNIYLLFAYPFLFFWAYGPTFTEEDEALHSIHGDEFVAFIKDTPQVFPSAAAWGKLRNLFAGFSRKRVTVNELKRVIRFAGIGCFIMLVHDLSEEGWRELLFWARPQDYDGAVYVILFVLLALASILMPRRVEFAS